MNSLPQQVCIVGSGYVGLPLAVGFAKHLPTIGSDVNETRVKELQELHPPQRADEDWNEDARTHTSDKVLYWNL